MSPAPPLTPDGRYLIVRGVLWRASNPNLTPEERQKHVDALMAARLDVKKHLHTDAMRLKEARGRVQAAKVALGERGPPWWQDGTPCLNRHKVTNTPYASWFQSHVLQEGRKP